MRKFFTCAGLALLGFIITYGLYMTVGMIFLKILRHPGGGSPERYIGVAFLAILPFFLFIGSLISGYLGQRYISNPYLFIFICPGIYLSIWVLASSGGTIEGYRDLMIICSLVWVITSLVGVYAGKYLRTRLIKTKNANQGIHRSASSGQ